MFDHMFDMIAESAEVALTREEYRKALKGLRAQVLTTPEEGMPEEQETWAEEWHRRVGLRAQVLTTLEEGTPEEQETWAEEWHRRVQRLTASLASDALRGIGLGVPTEDKAVFIQMHGVCAMWRAEAAQRVEEKQ
ncbi:hypothetical protein PAXINDRAFT_15576 [Paxillus involutus ATCC 200175]|uniref:Uncharacterized protein n=1 Tax=Paxillus involutus ATCC 200175 TaxID=664439 RepID=A0A0C9TWB1_PAXIN|nr:hypothetical protein PAXINDRAFT_15576 [Paxillus involutus ATCC 200175]